MSELIQAHREAADSAYLLMKEENRKLLVDKEALEKRNRKLEELQAEIEPYAFRLEPEVVMYKASVNTPSLAEFAEKFLTIMRSE